MAEISRITLPSGNTYDLKDATAREMIAGGVSFIVAWNGSSTPTVANIPKGVVVTYNGTNYTGTLEASAAVSGAFYLVKSNTSVGTLDVYDEYVVADVGGTKQWEKLGDTQVDLSDVVTGVTLNKQTDVALGEATTFALSSGTVTHGTPTKDNVLGADTTFSMTQPTITVTPTTRYLSASASGTAVGADGTASAITGFGNHTTDTFVKSVSADTTKKLETTTVPNVTANTAVTIPNVTGNTTVTIPNVTSAGSASTWSFTMGTGDNAETLVIGGGNGTAPTLGTALSASKVTLGTALSASKVTLGTAKTVATGAATTSGTGAAVVTDITIGDSAAAITALGTPTTSTVLTGVKVTTQPSITLTANTATASGRIQYMQAASASASGGTVSAGTNDTVSAVTAMPSSSVGTGITVGTNDKVTALTNSTTITVTKDA